MCILWISPTRWRTRTISSSSHARRVRDILCVNICKCKLCVTTSPRNTRRGGRRGEDRWVHQLLPDVVRVFVVCVCACKYDVCVCPLCVCRYTPKSAPVCAVYVALLQSIRWDTHSDLIQAGLCAQAERNTGVCVYPRVRCPPPAECTAAVLSLLPPV